MDKAIKITDDDYKIIKLIQDKEEWTLKKTLSKAIRFFANAKKILKD
jgi:hypothetical protein